LRDLRALPTIVAMKQSIVFAAALLLPSLAFADRPADLAFEIKERSSFTKSEIVGKLVTWKLGEQCWDKVLDKKQATLGRVGTWAAAIASYAKQVTGDDWEKIESQGQPSDREKNREIVAKQIAAFAPKFHLTVNVEGADCAKDSALFGKYVMETVDSLQKYPPKASKVTITINVTEKAKGVKTVVSKDGSTFTITGAKDIEASGWPNEIANPFKRASGK
jgi:hypothetical protein